MHSSYKLTNSSEQVNLEVGVPHIQKLSSDKFSHDFRLYCELTVEAQKLVSFEEEKLCNTTETILVEPHYFNVSCTPLTQQFLQQEARQKAKAEQNPPEVQAKSEEPTPTPLEEPRPSKSSLRRKSIDKKSAKENTYSKLVEERRLKHEYAAKKPPPERPPPNPPKTPPPPVRLPTLPTAPIPVSELPPDSVRTPPKQIPKIIPALSSLTPIPLKDLNSAGQTTTATTSAAAQNPPESISIQVPMQGADGTQILQTINVPKSVLAGASERPVLLTVTPKNGVNKGQKQIVVLTKNGNSFGASVKPANPPAPLQSSPSKVVLSQRPPQQTGGGGGGMTQAGINTLLAASKPVTDINSLLAAAKPVPSSELKGFQNTLTNSPATSQPKPQVLSSQAVVVSNPTPVSVVSLLQNSGRTVIQQAGGGGSNQSLSVGQRVIQQQVAAQPTVSAAAGSQQQRIITQQVGQPGQHQRIIQQISGQQQVNASGQRVVHTLVQPGQILPNGQQVVIRNGKPVLIPATPAAIAAAAGSQQQIVKPTQRPANQAQLPAGKIVLTQKGQVIQGAQAQALAGKIINTSQGQFIIGANGQLVSTQKLIQNHMSNQTMRLVVSTARTVVGSTATTTLSAGTPQRAAVAVTGANPAAVTKMLGSLQPNMAAGARTIQLGSAAAATSPAAAGVRPQLVAAAAANPAALGGSPTVLSGTGSSPASSAANPAFNQMILNALSNRGLLSQQNGKFVYVGTSQNKSNSPVTPSSVSIPLSSLSTPSSFNPSSSSTLLQSPSTFNPSANASPSTMLSPSPNLQPSSASLQTPPSFLPSPSPQQPAPADKSMVQARVIVSAPNLDSFNASPSLLRMASSLMEDPSIAELINTPCETGDQSSQQNGDINLYGVKTLAKATAVADFGANSMVAKATAVQETQPRSFYYRDPRLPEGWYVKVEPSQSGNVVVNYFTSNGDRLRSLSEVAHFLKNKLVTLPSCRGFVPPAPLAEIPRLDQLGPEQRAMVPTLALPAVDANSPVIRQIDSEIIEPTSSFIEPMSSLKRPAPVNSSSGQDLKKSKIVFF